ncbi:Hypothetical protein R9X50_00431000 [Acrodontium crateriforme]|uniref:Pentatricopeptide repeat protein n=1 Tax=Acrodontium crateriforme TaxID=150365 RepID=A0AAQ3M568_9PEZI|nr:Hypothetical protein R9X50_00431000 [Acrodontium crateriforme]
MQCHGSLARPLRDIIKSIGVLAHHPHPSATRPALWTLPSTVNVLGRRLRSCTAASPSPSPPQPVSASIEASTADSSRSPHDSSKAATVPENTTWSSDHAFVSEERESILAERERALAEREKVLAEREGFLARQRLAEPNKKSQKPSQRRTVRTDHAATGPPSTANEATIRVPARSDAESGKETHLDEDDTSSERLLFNPARRSDGTVKQSYLKLYSWSEQQKAHKRERNIQIQHERHHQQSGTHAEWLDLLNLLTRATPQGAKFHQRSTETVRLPDGVHAKFKLPASLAILELMLRTGSHAQMTFEQRSGNEAFSVVTLWGTAAENAHAIKILPDLVHFISPELDEIVNNEATPDDLNVQNAFEAGEIGDGEHQNAERLQDSVDDLVGTTPADHKSVPIRTVWSAAALADVPVKEIISHRPTKWSVNELALYVEALTAPVSRIVRRSQQGLKSQDPNDHRQLVTEELHSLFVQSPEVAPFITEPAVNKALGFFILNNSWAHLRVIFNAVEHNINYQVTASNYNVMLGAAADTGDFFNFQLLSRRMLERGLQPTWRTWVHFYKLASVKPVIGSPAKILRRMRAHGILANTSAYRESAQIAVATEFRTLFFKHNVSLDKIFQIYDERWRVRPGLGSQDGTTRKARQRHWLTVSAASHMIHALLTQARTKEALNVLIKLEESGEKASTAILNDFLSAAERGRDPASAVAALQRLDAYSTENRKLKPDRNTYEILFDLAWRAQYFNMLRVIWRYACTTGNVSYKMQRTILQSLQTYVPTRDTREKIDTIFRHERSSLQTGYLSRIDWWFGLAGKFAIGVNVGLQRKNATDELSDRETKIFDLVASPSDKADHIKRSVRSKDLLLRDMNEALSLTPTTSLAVALEQAWRADRRWRDNGIATLPTKTELPSTTRKAKSQLTQEHVASELLALYKQSMKKMLENGVNVPMELGDATTSTKA